MRPNNSFEREHIIKLKKTYNKINVYTFKYVSYIDERVLQLFQACFLKISLILIPYDLAAYGIPAILCIIPLIRCN